MTAHEEYVTRARFASIVGCANGSVAKVAKANRVRIRQVPGLAPRYHRGDIEAIAAKIFRVAGSEDQPATSNKQTVHEAASV